MRSCTGWPSGVWLDPPARHAPDGSAFQLQHWTHDFDYALVSGAGDWRATDLVARGSEFTTPLLARTNDAHPGPLPPQHSLLTVEPARQVQVPTIKATGNPHATGTTPTDNHELTVRLVETTGKATTATVSTPFGWADAHETDLLEQRVRAKALTGQDITIELTGSRIATVVGTPAQAADPSGELLGSAGEIAQPIYTRYWLHNRGPAPAGFLPVSVAVDPTAHRIAPGDTVTGTVVLASHLRDAAVESTVDVRVPAGWTADPGTRPVRLAEGGHTRFPLTVTAPADAEPGLYFARVRLAVGTDLLEDVITMVVRGGAADDIIPPPAGPELNHAEQLKGTTADSARPLGLELSVVTEAVDLACGEKAVLTVRASNTAADDIDGEAMVVSPWGTWHLIGPYTNGFHVPAGQDTEISFEVSAPAHAQPGTWWAMVKLMWFGRVQYSPAIPVRVHLP
jgi:hypothetical protein